MILIIYFEVTMFCNCGIPENAFRGSRGGGGGKERKPSKIMHQSLKSMVTDLQNKNNTDLFGSFCLFLSLETGCSTHVPTTRDRVNCKLLLQNYFRLTILTQKVA
jgi:hypothetical protein